jgi:hypothetical protein
MLVRADGITYQLEDLEDFQEAFNSGLYGKTWFDGAKREIDWLVDLLESGGFLDFLNEVAPFPKTRTTNILPPMQRRLIDETHFEYHPQYPRYE